MKKRELKCLHEERVWERRQKKEKAWEAGAGDSEGHNELCIHFVLSGERCDGEKPG